MMSNTFGDRPRPWLLAFGFAPTDPLGEIVSELAPTVHFLRSDDFPANQIREADFDAIVVLGSVNAMPARNLHVIQFGGLGETQVRPGANGFRYGVMPIGRAGRLSGPDSTVSDKARELVESSLAPWLVEQNPRGLISRLRPNNTSFGDADGVRVLVQESGGLPAAGIWNRGDSDQGSTEWWWLPEDAPDKAEWIAAALEEWGRTNPAAFPTQVNDWTTESRWMNAAELEATAGLRRAEEALASALAEHRALVDAAEVSVAQATREATDTDRRLLTKQGDGLKSQLHKALTELGFEVVDSDVEREDAGEPLLEDLQIRNGDWVAIVEVRGYAKSGGKTSDLLRLGRAATSFERRHGSAPTARWYVVNHHMTTSPSRRPPVLAGAESDIDEFALVGGLVVDARHIFALVQGVRQGKVDADAVRAALVQASGRVSDELIGNLIGET
jgi:hypothetical protein